jgi:hypothetical protein
LRQRRKKNKKLKLKKSKVNRKKKTKFCTITPQEETEAVTKNPAKIWVLSPLSRKLLWKIKKKKVKRKTLVHLSSTKIWVLNPSQNSISKTTAR